MWLKKKGAIVAAVCAALSLVLASAQTPPGGPGGGPGGTTGTTTTSGGSPGGTSGWEVTFGYQGTSKTTYTVLNPSTGQKQTQVDTNTWPAGPYGTAQTLQAGQAPIVGDMVHAGEVDGTVNVKVRWIGTPSAQPTEFFVAITSNATGFWAIDGSGGGDAQANNGLKVGNVTESHFANTHTKSHSGFKRMRYDYSGGYLTIPIKVYAKGLANGVGSQGTASCFVNAWITNKALFIHSPTPTYKRNVGTDPYNGQPVGIPAQNYSDHLGHNYGDYGVEMTKMGGAGGFAYSYSISYAGSLVGSWGNDSEVYNMWTCDKPFRWDSDPILGEAHGITVSDNFPLLSTPLDTSFVMGSKVLQTITWKADDQTDGISEETKYFMTLHPQAHKEEEYKAQYSGYLHNPASGVSATHPAHILFNFRNPNATEMKGFKVEVTTQRDTEEGWETEGSAGLNIVDILDLTFGIKKTVSTSTSISIGYNFTIDLPANHTIILWALPQGKVKFWNMSKWGVQGYTGDFRTKDVREVTHQQAPMIYPGAGGPPPLT